jgi:hypothetical protein
MLAVRIARIGTIAAWVRTSKFPVIISILQFFIGKLPKIKSE